MADNMYVVWQKLFNQRTNPLWTRFPGIYRAIVVETNDPLNMMRVRFKCPDLHDWDLKPSECPWAVPAPEFGGKRAGHWLAPCIGDWVWIDFERGHPYGPVWVGFATPTRRRYYGLPAIYQKSPVSVNDQGQAVTAPDDFNADYLPKDGRPMVSAFQDRYGNLDLFSAVGFFPSEHDRPPPPPDFDPVQDAAFKQAQAVPIANDPDAKFMARITKYGHILILGDQGYTWQKKDSAGEFSGDVTADEQFEINRWKYLQRLLNEDKPNGGDQRHILIMTRYGHKFEMRDTGWAQPGPLPSRSRLTEYGMQVHLSLERTNDFRWIKLRTKGGWLLQAYDKGFDPDSDDFISRPLLNEVGAKSEREDIHWANKDARWFRIVGRHGFKFVIDERGSDPRQAHNKESPRGNGILLKGRRTGGCRADGAVSGDPRGFYFEFNENDDANHTTWGTPLGQAIEMNDATEYMALVVGVGRDYARPYRGLEENEFLLEPTRARQPEERSYHLIFDHQNEFLRLKTRAGRGDAARHQVNPSALGVADLHQGLEAHDGSLGDGPWVEVVDAQGRGIWMSRNNKLTILRAATGKKLYLWFDDDRNDIVIYNEETVGRIQIYSKSNIELISEATVTITGKNVNIKADEKIRFEEARMPFKLQSGGDLVDAVTKASLPAKVAPSDRAASYNTPSVIAADEIEHPI